MNEGLECELYAFALAHDGRAICKLSQEKKHDEAKNAQGQVVFVPHVLPDEKFLARITKVKKKYALGEVIRILESPNEQNLDTCAHAHLCGGCTLQKMPYVQQLFWKEKIVRDSIERIANIKSCQINPIIASPKIWNYRNKMEFAFAGAKGKLSLGLRQKASHEVVNVNQCKLMPEIAMQIISKVRELANKLGLSAYGTNETSTKAGFLRFVIVRIPLSQPKQEQCLINIITSQADATQYVKVQKLAEELMSQCKDVTGFAHDVRYNNDNIAVGDKSIFRVGQTKLHERLSGIDYELGHKSFFQINTAAAEFLGKELEHSLEFKGNEILWDLYAGVGAPCMFLANKVKQIAGLENSAQAVKLANNNAKKNNFSQCIYYTGQAGQTLQTMKGLEKPDIVVMDPPRAGLHHSVVNQLEKIKPRQIVYISCDSATLSRDLKLLARQYDIVRIQPIDFFPQTPHVESVVALRLK